MGLSRVFVLAMTTLLVAADALSACAASDPRAEQAGALLDDAMRLLQNGHKERP